MRVNNGRSFIGRFPYKTDLLLSISEFCKKENIRLGVFTVIGALTSVRLGYYDREKDTYVECASLDKKLEITSCTGNISLKDSDIFIHAHITLADLSAQCYGGHLMKGSLIFAAEYRIQELIGGKMQRVPDTDTGLHLWP